MMELEKLRKADIFSGGLISIFGLAVIGISMTMPMKDSWGGVHNVWYVSPAIFPLFIGIMLVILGLLLVRTAVKVVGGASFFKTLTYLGSSAFFSFLQQRDVVRFYAVVFCLLSFVFLMVPRVDFFLAAALFLLGLFSMFYLGDGMYLGRLFFYYCAGMVMLAAVAAVSSRMHDISKYPNDWFVLLFLLVFAIRAAKLAKESAGQRKEMKTILILALATPLFVGVVFKYFLLVPLPFEGLTVQLLDTVWYAEIW